MVKRVVIALFFLFCMSGSVFAIIYGLSKNPNMVYINIWIDRSGSRDVLLGIAYYSQMVFTRQDERWHIDPFGPPNVEQADAKGLSGPLANQVLEISYSDENGQFVEPREVQTDENGLFSYNLAGLPPGEQRCTRIRVFYAGDDEHGYSESKSETVYCSDYEYALPLVGIQSESCFPIFIIFGILVGAMYVSGNDPLRAFDLSTPRLPGPKPKPMAGVTPYVPGWKLQRLGQIRISKDFGRGLERELDMLLKQLQLAAGSTRPIAAGLRDMLNAYKRERFLIDLIRSSRYLTITQRSLLIELLLIGGGKYFPEVTAGKEGRGVDKETLRSYLANGNKKELERISKQMEEISASRRMMDIRNMIREEIGRYDRELQTLPDSKQRINEPAFRAWNILTWISGKDMGDGNSYAGIRMAKEQADYAFEVSRKWAGLGGRFGKFLATTPGLRGEIATAVGSVRMITGIYGRILRTVAVDGIAKKLVGSKDGGSTAGRDNETLLDRLSQSRKYIGNLGDGFEGMSLSLREVVAELRRRGLLTKEQVEEILKESKNLYRKSIDLSVEYNKTINNTSISRVDKEARLEKIRNDARALQKEYEALLSRKDLRDGLEKALKQQQDEEQKGTRNSLLSKQIAETIIERMSQRDISSREFQRMRADLESAKKKLSRGGLEDSFEFAEIVTNFSEKSLASMKKHKEEVDAIRRALGGKYDEKIVDRINERTRPEDIVITKFISRIIGTGIKGRADERGLLQEELDNVRLALKSIERLEFSKRYKNFSEIQARLKKTEAELSGLWKELEGIKKEGERPARSTNDYMSEQGYLGSRSIGFINRFLAQYEKYGKIKARDSIIPKEEIDKLREQIRKDAAVSGSEAGRLKMEVESKVLHMQRAELTGRIRRMLKEGRERELVELLEDVRSEQWISGRGRMERFFSVGNRITEKDIARPDDRSVVEFKRVLADRSLKNDEKAQRLTNLLVEVFPWHRKMKTEYFEAFVANQTIDFKSSMRIDIDYENFHKRNFIGVNIAESNRRLNAWRLSNEEILERGLIPGGKITHEEAATRGGWISRPEGYWIPLNATRKGGNASAYGFRSGEERRIMRDQEMEINIRQNLSEADRIVYASLDKKTGQIKETKYEGVGSSKYMNLWDSMLVAGLHDLGAEASIVKTAITQTWQTLDSLKLRYENQQIYNMAKGQVTTLSEIKSDYMKAAFSRKLKALEDSYERLNELNGKLEQSQDGEERKRLENEIKEEKRRIKREMKENERLIRALAHDVTIFDVLSRKREERARESDFTGLPFYEKIDLISRQKYGQDIKDFDPILAKIMKSAAIGMYEMAFLGIVAVRSGRATSSLYGDWGYIATGQSHFGPAAMNPRRYNWVGTEWSENDVLVAAYGGPRWQQNIPVLRHLTYGRYLWLMSLIPMSVAQQFSAATSQFNIRSSGIPSPWEPQYLDYHKTSSGIKELIPAVMHFIPPFTFFTYPGLWLNPAKDGWFARSALGRAMHVSDIKYGIYNVYSKLGGRNYTMLGKTGKDDYRAGGPSWMAFADKFYTSTYLKGYPPVYFTDPYGRSSMFPGFVRTLEKSAPGLMDSNADRIVPDIFRRETDAKTNLEERMSYMEMEKRRYGGLWGLTTPGFVWKTVYKPVSRIVSGKFVKRERLCTCGQRGRHICPLRGGKVYEEV